MHEGRPCRARPLTEAFGGPEQPRRQGRPVRARQPLEARRLEHRVAELARGLEPLLEPLAGRRVCPPSGGDVAQSAHPAQRPPAIAEIPKLGQGFLEQRVSSFQVTVGATIAPPASFTFSPLAYPVSQSVTTGTPATVQLNATNNNPNNTAVMTAYSIVNQPTHGTLSQLNASTGTVV